MQQGTVVLNDNQENVEVINLNDNVNNEETTREYDEEGNEESKNNLELGEYDFALILNHNSEDITVVTPQLEDFNELSEENKIKISQNHFYVGFLNYAMNCEEWINQYSEFMYSKANDYLLGLLGNFQNQDGTETCEEDVENVDEVDNHISFEESIQELSNDKKPKIIT